MRIKDFFTVPEGEKVTEQVFHRVLISTICSMLLCMTCLFGTTWAWFVVSIENTGNVIEIATDWTEPSEEATTEPGEESTGEEATQPGEESTEEETTEPNEEPTEEATTEPGGEPTEESTTDPGEESTEEPTGEETVEETTEPETEAVPGE